ncbi:MAG TPA: S-adenosylmethionine:tRNA ribosyltransferase-isomerase [Gaiellaceae bacterium]
MSALRFELPPRLEAHEPPEARGLARDGVRLMVATAHDLGIEHARFHDLPRFLRPGDLLVVNTSRTLPAALPAQRRGGEDLELRLSTPAPDWAGSEWWVVEVRANGGASPFGALDAGEQLELPEGGSARLVTRYAGRRLWLARLELPEPLAVYLGRHGRPIRYGYVGESWPLDAYQNVYAAEPGSAEMPSAGRPFTTELVTRLVAAGVLVAPITLHTGVSSPELGERPYPERYRVPEPTARLVNAVRDWGGRVVAVGTTVVRSLETVAGPDSAVSSGAGWTNLVVTPERGLRVVDGLLTGWHEPRASHLELLHAVAGHELLERSYAAALEHGYLWHEFGDVHLILP